MPMPTFPLINGRRFSFASLDCRVRGIPVVGIKELSYSDKLEPGAVRGTKAQSLGRTLGDYECDGSITIYREEFDALVAELGDGYGGIAFDITAHYADEGQPTSTDEVRGCRIKNVENNPSQGTDPLEVKLDLDVMYILRNGKCLLPGLVKG